MSPVTALLLRICSNVVRVGNVSGTQTVNDEDDEQPHVDGADVAEGERAPPLRRAARRARAASRRVARMPRRGPRPCRCSSSASFHRVEQVRFGDLVAGQLGRDDAVAQDEHARAHADAGRPRPTRRRSRRRRRGPARRRGRRAASACRCRRPAVGSHRARTCEPSARQRAMTTFCWLPPLSVVIGASEPAVRMPRRSIQPSTRSASRRRASAARPPQAAEHRQRQVLPDAERADDALGRAVGRDEGDARRVVLGEVDPRVGLRGQAHGAAHRARPGAGERVGQGLAARAGEAGDAEHLALADGEAHATQDPGVHVARLERGRSRGARRLAAARQVDVLADHHRRERLRGQVGDVARADDAAAAQDRDAVGDARRSRRSGATRRGRSCRPGGPRARSRAAARPRSCGRTAVGSSRTSTPPPVQPSRAAAMATTVRSTGVASFSGRCTSMSMPNRPMSARAVRSCSAQSIDPSRVRAYPRLQRQVVRSALSSSDEPEVLVDEAQPVVAVADARQLERLAVEPRERAGVGRVVAGEGLDQRRLAASRSGPRARGPRRARSRASRRAARASRRTSWTAARGAARAAGRPAASRGRRSPRPSL